jgi:hypothetical protein
VVYQIDLPDSYSRPDRPDLNGSWRADQCSEPCHIDGSAFAASADTATNRQRAVLPNWSDMAWNSRPVPPTALLHHFAGAEGLAVVPGALSPFLPHWIGFTVIVCWTWGAAWYLPLSAWLASMTQLPGWPKVTVDPEIEHAELVEDGSMLKVTGFSEPPPRAVTT